MIYHFLMDKVQIFCRETGYVVQMIKTVRAAGGTPVEFVYARIDVSICPEDTKFTSNYYRDHPISLENLKFSAIRDGHYPLRIRTLHEYPSNLELAILMQSLGETLPRPLIGDDVAQIKYRFEPTYSQWGSWLQRDVRVPTDLLVVSLIFPRGSVTCTGATIVGGDPRPLKSPLVHRRTHKFDWWRWECRSPDMHHRFRFAWSFKDHRDQRIVESIKRKYGDLAAQDFMMSPDGRSARWFGTTITFSPKQGELVSYVSRSTNKIFSKISMHDVCDQMNWDSEKTRVRDLFKFNPLFGTLVVAAKGFISLDYSAKSYQRYVSLLKPRGDDE